MQAGKYVWLTYQEVYDRSIEIGSAIRSTDVGPVSIHGIEIDCPFLVDLINHLIHY